MSDVFWAAFGGGAAAGIFSLIALLFAEWFRVYLDRPLVKVKASWVIYFQGTQTEQKISIQAINPHSRPVL
jgi:hypothetical protein